MNAFLAHSAQNGLIAYLDAGIYVVTDTIYIPPGSKIVGEALSSVIMGSGPKFQNMTSPQAVVQVGRPGESGYLEWSDTIVSTRGGCAGAILIEYNLFTDGIPSGMWEVHTRIGGSMGTDLQLDQCPAVPRDDVVDPSCIAAYMSVRVTANAGGLHTENCWYWCSDHDLENQDYSRISIFAGRGLLVESLRGRIWLSATSSEHHVLYQYQLNNARNVFLGYTQTESPYFQPRPPASLPFPRDASINDPDFVRDCLGYVGLSSCQSAWGMRIINSQDIVSYGTGLYSFFNTYNNSCAVGHIGPDCQARILSVSGNSSNLKFVSLNTVGTKIMVQQNGKDLVPGRINNSTFADSLALYES